MKHITKMLYLTIIARVEALVERRRPPVDGLVHTLPRLPTFSRRRPFARYIAPNLADWSIIIAETAKRNNGRDNNKRPQRLTVKWCWALLGALFTTDGTSIELQPFAGPPSLPFHLLIAPPPPACLLNRINVKYCNNVSIYIRRYC
jgi:hypothetical protein